MKPIKIALIAVGAAGLLSVTLGFGALAWWEAKKKDFEQEGQASTKEGETFAKDTDQNGCLKEMLVRLDVCSPSIVGGFCRGRTIMFFYGCIDHSRPSEGFCDGVPAQTSAETHPQWARDRCTAHGRSDDHCASMMTVIAPVCDPNRKKPSEGG